jgi:hypothetical protein
VEQKEYHSFQVGMQLAWPLWKTSWWFLTKLNMFLPHNWATTLLGIHPEELETYVCMTPAHQCFLHNCSNLDATSDPSEGEWMHHHPCNGTPLTTNRQRAVKPFVSVQLNHYNKIP